MRSDKIHNRRKSLFPCQSSMTNCENNVSKCVELLKGTLHPDLAYKYQDLGSVDHLPWICWVWLDRNFQRIFQEFNLSKKGTKRFTISYDFTMMTLMKILNRSMQKLKQPKIQAVKKMVIAQPVIDQAEVNDGVLPSPPKIDLT